MIKKAAFFILLLLLVYVSVFPRVTEVVAHNYIFGFDQGRDYLAAKSIAFDHKLTLIGSEWGAGSAGFTGLFHGPFYFYLLAFAFLLFGGDPYGGVVIMFLLGIFTIVLSFVIGRKILGTVGAYTFTLLITLSPPLIAQSRFFWNSYPSSPFILLAFYFVYKSTLLRRSLDLFLAAFFSGFIYNFQTAIAIPMVLGLLIYSVIILRLKKVKQYLVLLGGIILAFSPMVLFEFRHGFQGGRGLLAYLFADKKTDVTLLFMQRLLADHLGSYFYNLSNSFPNIPVPWWALLLIILIPLLYCWYQEKNGALRLFIIYLFFLPITSFLVFSSFRNSVYQYYLYELTFVYLFFFAYVVSQSLIQRKPVILALYVVFLVSYVVTGVVSAYSLFAADVKDYGGGAKIKGKIDALDYIYTDAKDDRFNLLIFAPPVYTYPYDYLIWWYGRKQYGFTPGSEKQGTLYLLIEKDHSKPWSYKGWLETVIQEGTVEKTETLPSGLIVQKRIINK
ncbi:MAG: glycosyltransferase family 39 protein [Candidatus Levybacteria bacterium]|nr:glycosyltransferase family 39 protein [Candidatus Levybacteria bacterium]